MINIDRLKELFVNEIYLESNLMLSTNDFEINTQEDSSGTIRFELKIFGERHSAQYVSLSESISETTLVDRFVNDVRDNGNDVKSALESGKGNSLENDLEAFAIKVKELIATINPAADVFTMVDDFGGEEKYYSNGFPIYEFEVRVNSKTLVFEELDFNLKNFKDEIVLRKISDLMQK